MFPHTFKMKVEYHLWFMPILESELSRRNTFFRRKWRWCWFFASKAHTLGGGTLTAPIKLRIILLWCVQACIILQRLTSAGVSLLCGFVFYLHRYSQCTKSLWRLASADVNRCTMMKSECIISQLNWKQQLCEICQILWTKITMFVYLKFLLHFHKISSKQTSKGLPLYENVLDWLDWYVQSQGLAYEHSFVHFVHSTVHISASAKLYDNFQVKWRHQLESTNIANKDCQCDVTTAVLWGLSVFLLGLPHWHKEEWHLLWCDVQLGA